MNILIDSSAWIEFFRGNLKYLFIKDLISANAICINDIILSELLPSIIHRKEHTLAKLLSNIRKCVMTVDWQEIRTMQLSNLKHGSNNIGISDIIIVQNCLQNRLKIVAHDKHFMVMAKYLPLVVYR